MDKFKKMRIIIIPIMSVVLILIGFLLQNTELRIFSYLIYYAALICFLVLFSDIKWLRLPILVIATPLILIELAIRLLTPISTWFLSQFFAIASIVLLTIKLPDFFGYTWTTATKVYVALTLIAIVLTQFGNKIFVLWLSFYERHKIYEDVGFQIYNQKRTRFIIFTSYFILLSFTTFYNLVEIQFFRISRLDYAILQSFATYIAFDRIMSIYDATRIMDRFKAIYKEYLKVIKIEIDRTIGNNRNGML